MMSPAITNPVIEPRARARDGARQDGGFTMLEMTIAMMMLLTLSFLVTNMIISGNKAQKYADRLGRVTEITQEITDGIQRDLRSAVRLFEDTALGNAYRARLQPWAGITPLPTSRLPRIDPDGSLEKDVSGSEKTGNELCFVRHGWSDSFTCSSGETYRVDVYRIVRYFMMVEGDGPTPKYPWGLNLVKWTSEPLISAAQLDHISDPTDQAEMLQHLREGTPDDHGRSHSKAFVVWRMGEDPSLTGTFQHVMSSGLLTDAPQAPRSPTWEIERAEDMSDPGLLFYRHHSVATNYAQANQGVGRFGIRDDTGTGFPHGFEFQVVGPASARKVLIHLTTVSTNMNGMKAYYDSQVITAVREG